MDHSTGPRGGSRGGRVCGARDRDRRRLSVPAPALLVAASVLVLLLAAAPAGAQDYQVFGDVEGAATYHYLEEADAEHRLTGIARLRADHRLTFKRAELVADTEIELRSRGAADPETAFVPGGAGSAGGSTGDTADGELDYYIDEAYLTLFPLTPVTVSAGKQRVNWGTGYTFTPTDTLHPRSNEERDEGFRGVSATWTPTADFTVAGHVSIDDALDDPDARAQSGMRYAAYTSAFLGNAQLFVSGVYGPDSTARPGIGGSAGIGGVVVAAEAAVELLNPVAYPTGSGAEAAFESDDPGTPAPLAIAAVEYNAATDMLDFVTTSEYLYAGTGYTRSEARDFYDALAAALPGLESEELPRFLGRHYLSQTLSLGIAGYVELEAGLILNASDLSYRTENTLRVTALEGVDFFTTARWYGGAADTEFGTFPDGSRTPGRVQVELGSLVHF